MGISKLVKKNQVFRYHTPRVPLSILAFCLLLITIAGCSNKPKFDFEKGDTIAFVGNALAERMQYYGYLETYLQAAHPDDKLVFRNLGFTGDQVHHRPRASENFGDADSHLSRVGANVIFAFFGYNESYNDTPQRFKERLAKWIEHTRAQKYGGESAPRIVLFSPIKHENLHSSNLPSGKENNKRLKEYTQVMAEVAKAKKVTFVNLFEGTNTLYQEFEQPLTVNGVHLNEEGNQQVAQYITEKLDGSLPDIKKTEQAVLRQAVLAKNWHWFYRYRATDGNDVWGSRSDLHGNGKTLHRELEMLDVMTANRDKYIWSVTQDIQNDSLEINGTDSLNPRWGKAYRQDLGIDDSNVPQPVDVKSNYTKEVEFLSGKEAIEGMHLAEGLDVNLYASEKMFPEIANPVTIKTDTKGRIWVAAWATYPKWEPMKKMNDKLVVLSDTDNDGVADEATTFATIQNPTGFEFWNGGVIVVSAPNIWFLKDTDGDGKADKRILLLGGIDSADTHHSANNIVLGPDGWIYYQRGVFLLCNVETPWRANFESDKSGLYRFNPRTFEFDFVVKNGPNPHGISFDKWGYQYITDATTGRAYQVYLDQNNFDVSEFQYFKKRKLLEKTVRPVPGNQLFSSAHFPEEYQQDFLIYNVIGFRGIKRYDLNYDNGVVYGEEVSELIYSDDPNFRPTSGTIGKDGALYISDWHNPLIGHMQHNIRDPHRDHTHGRIYRITAEGRPLQEPVSIDGESIEHLLGLLQHPTDGVRHRVHIELSERDTDKVIKAAQEWVQPFSPDTKEGAHAMLEVLWLHQQHNVVNRELLEQLLNSPIEHAHIAAQRVAWEWRHREEAQKNAAVSETTNTAGEEAAQEASGNVEIGKEVDLTDQKVAKLTVNTVKDKMLYDTQKIIVNTGQTVKLTLNNVDYKPHNLVILKPETMDKVVKEVLAMGGEGFEKEFVPDSPNVLHATGLISYQKQQTLTFTAPSEPGKYPFVCTFPGHWQTMRGVIVVKG